MENKDDDCYDELEGVLNDMDHNEYYQNSF